MSKKTYLGDSVYANYDGFYVILTTENGVGASNTICLEDTVIDAFFRYLERLYNIKISTKTQEKED